MRNPKSIVILGRNPDANDRLTRILENAGYIAASTTNDSTAIDMAAAPSCQALLITASVPEPDRRYTATQTRNRNPDITVLTVNSPRAILTQLAQHLPG